MIKICKIIEKILIYAMEPIFQAHHKIDFGDTYRKFMKNQKFDSPFCNYHGKNYEKYYL